MPVPRPPKKHTQYGKKGPATARLAALLSSVVCDSEEWTYEAFGERVNQLSRVLARLGVGKGDRVACLSYHCHRLLEGYFSVVQMAAILLPLNIRLYPEDVTVILNHSGTRVLLVHPDFLETLLQIRPDLESVEQGRVLAEGRPDAIVGSQEVRAAFLGVRRPAGVPEVQREMGD